MRFLQARARGGCAAPFQQALSSVEFDDLATWDGYQLDGSTIRDDKAVGGPGYNFTVFIPTDEAILAFFGSNDLAAPTDSFFKDNEQTTRELLVYHLVNGAYSSDELQSGDALHTRLGDGNGGDSKLNVVNNGDGLTIVGDESQANIVVADIPICHGVVHLIDSVLFPKGFASYIIAAQDNK